MSRLAKTVRYTRAAGATDADLMLRASEAVEDVECGAHKDAGRVDSLAAGTASISACCRPALERAEKAFNAATK
jgi:hypothetical protein